MKHLIILVSLSFLMLGCKSNVTTRDLIVELESYFDGKYIDADIDSLANFSFDMGSASAGRISGNLRKVFISMEILPERTGCADICPEMVVIHFKCENNQRCISDPADPKLYGYYNEGVITFENLETGERVYQLLNLIKEKL